MSIFTITLEDNDKGVLVKAHAVHTAEQMLSGNTTTIATTIGTEIAEHILARLNEISQAAATIEHSTLRH